MSNNKVSVVLGSQWGDEGKGKLVDILASDADVVARCAVSILIIINFFYLFKILLLLIINKNKMLMLKKKKKTFE